MDLSIIILSYNTKELTRQAIGSILKNTRGINYEIIVVDNASVDGSDKMLTALSAREKRLTLIKSKKNLGFSRGNNLAAKHAQGKYLLFLNADTLLHDNILRKIVDWMEQNKRAGIVSCALKNKDGTLQGNGGYFPTLIRVFSWMTIQDFPLVDRIIKPFHPMKDRSFGKADSFYVEPKEIDWVTGAFLMVRRKLHEQIKGFDKDFFMYSEDVDYCYRAKKHSGCEVWYLPQWSITHYGGASSSAEYPVLMEYEGIQRFYSKHYPAWQGRVLRFILKLGSLGRVVLFTILPGRGSKDTYVKAFKKN